LAEVLHLQADPRLRAHIDEASLLLARRAEKGDISGTVAQQSMAKVVEASELEVEIEGLACHVRPKDSVGTWRDDKSRIDWELLSSISFVSDFDCVVNEVDGAGGGIVHLKPVAENRDRASRHNLADDQ